MLRLNSERTDRHKDGQNFRNGDAVSKFSIFRCVYKAKEGECQNNPEYMMQNCQAECRQFGVRFMINVTWYCPKVLPVIQLSTTRGAKIAS